MRLHSQSSRPSGVGSRVASGLAAVALACALALVGGAAVAGAGSDAHTAKPVLRVGIANDVSRPNPSQAGAGQTTLIYFGLPYEPIIHAKVDGSFAPGLATSWRYVPSKAGRNKVFELTLRRNAKFSNGQAVTAAAVAKWLNYFATQTGGQFNKLLGPTPTFTTPGKWTVRIQMKIPNPSLPFILSEMRVWGFVAAPQAVDDPSLFATGSYGAGPYVLVPSRSVTGDHYTYVPNRYYYNKAAIKYSEISVKLIPTPDTMLAALKSGQIDIAVGTAATSSAAKSAGFNVVSAPAVTDFMGFDRTAVLPDSKPLTDVRVRQAINHAMDRALIVRTITGGTATSEMKTADGFNPKLQNTYPYNPTKAKSLLAAAGYRDGFTLDLLYSPVLHPNGAELAQVLVKYLGDIGIKVNLTSAPTVGEYLTKLASRKYSAFLGTSGALPMVTWVPTTLLPGGVYNPFSVVDPTVAKYYYSGLKALKATDWWLKISERITKNAYFAPMYGGPVFVYFNKKVKGVAVSSERLGQTTPIEWFPAG